ncbi:hypothetical protein [Stappia sp.]|nr:hypothetical protein [Stappia sp.]
MTCFKMLMVCLALVALPLSQAGAHGGGCRKDSPPGKCCHAGSKPYHCH